MARVARKLVRWKVMLDGVEVPWQSISLKVGVDFVGQLEAVIEPDSVLRYLRAGTKVHLFMYDHDAPGDDEDLDKLFLYWEGELRSPQYQRSFGSRSQSITAEGEIAIFGRSKMYAHGFGAIANTHLVSGSQLIVSESYTLRDLVSYTILGKVLDPNVKNAIKKEELFRDTKNPNYSERIIRFMAYLSSYNALFRMQSVRSNIFGKMVAFNDEALGRLLPRALVNDYYTQARASIRPESTALDLINLLNSKTFYHYVSIAGPVVPSTGSPEEVSYVGFPGVNADDHLYSMPRRFFRNDYIFTPETFYAIPPSCNLIFPEFINSFSLGRDFMAEPTRALITNTHLNAPVSVVAPDDILRFAEEEPDQAQFWSLNQDGIKLEGNATSPYHSRSTKDSPSYNLFGVVSDEEIEKGIIAVNSYPSWEFFSAVSNAFDLKTIEGKAYLRSLLDSKLSMAASVLEGKTKRNRAFIYLMKALADYTLVLEKFRRRVSISLVGHRWIVPGFPCVIMDTTVSYIAYVRSYNLNISSNGDELGTTNLDFVRPFPLIDRRIIKKAEKAIEALVVVESETKKLSDKMDTFLSQVRKAESGYMFAVEIENFQDQDRYFSDTRRHYLVVYGAVRNDIDMLSRMKCTSSGLDVIKRNLVSFRPSEAAKYGPPAPPPKMSPGTYGPPAPPPEMLSDEDIKEVYRILKAYAHAIKDKADIAAKTLDANKVPTVPGLGDPTKTLKEAILSASLGDDYPEDFMVPPIFGNMDLLSVKKAEAIYNNLFGAKVVFSGEEGFRTEVGIPTDPGTTARILALKKQAYTKFVNFTKALNRVFPVLGSRTSETEGEVGTSEWEEMSSKMDSEESLRDWAETKFLKRERLQTLRQFLKVNGLELKKPLSDPPTQQKFLHFVPLKSFTLPSKSGMDLTWDNTCFSKIVDEFQIAKKYVKLRLVTGLVVEVPRDSDEEILRLRKSVKNPFLTTKARQAIILEYARKHHGSRGFSGA